MTWFMVKHRASETKYQRIHHIERNPFQLILEQAAYY